MAKQLNTTVHVHGHGIFGPGDKLPAEVRKLLADNPRVWGDDDGQDEEATRPGPSETAAAGAEVEAALRARIAELEAAAQATAQPATAGDTAGPSTSGAEEEPPPKSGAGSGAEAWRAFAAARGVTVPADAKRDDVVAELDRRGIPTERSEQ